MKLFSLVTAIGLGLAFSVGAQQQQSTDEEQQQMPAHKGKQKVEQTTGAQENVSAGSKVNEKGKVKAQAGVSAKETGAVSHSTTVFRNGQQTSEHLTMHRSTRDRADVHFSIGTHPRDWWLRTYSIAVFEGCHYYLADNGCWYPAYGFDPACNFQPGIVYCE